MEQLQEIEKKKMENQSQETVNNQENSQQNSEENVESATAYSCPNCGAEMITEENTAATFCAFCGSPAVFPKQLTGEFAAEKIIPFKFTKEQAVEALKKLCKSKKLLPKDFTDLNHIEKVTGIYVPFWLFDCKMKVDMEASAQRIQTWSDGKYRYTKTDFYRLEREGDFEVCGVPSDGLKKMDDAMMDALEPFDYSTMRDFEMSYLSGYFAEKYDVDKEASWAKTEGRIYKTAKALTEETLKGFVSTQIKDFNTKVCEKHSQYAMLPVWVLSTQYKEKNYLFMMNGQTGKMVGKLPLSWGKVAKCFALYGFGAFLVTLLGGTLLL